MQTCCVLQLGSRPGVSLRDQRNSTPLAHHSPALHSLKMQSSQRRPSGARLGASPSEERLRRLVSRTHYTLLVALFWPLFLSLRLLLAAEALSARLVGLGSGLAQVGCWEGCSAACLHYKSSPRWPLGQRCACCCAPARPPASIALPTSATHPTACPPPPRPQCAMQGGFIAALAIAELLFSGGGLRKLLYGAGDCWCRMMNGASALLTAEFCMERLEQRDLFQACRQLACLRAGPPLRRGESVAAPGTPPPLAQPTTPCALVLPAQLPCCDP